MLLDDAHQAGDHSTLDQLVLLIGCSNKPTAKCISSFQGQTKHRSMCFDLQSNNNPEPNKKTEEASQATHRSF